MPDNDMTSQFNPDGPGDTPMEAQLRQLLADRAGGLAPPETPYATILRHGKAAHRRGRIALGAGAAVLAAAVPATTVAVGNLWPDEQEPESTLPALPTPSREETLAPAEPPEARGPSDPERQLLDGFTLEEARAHLDTCMGEDPWAAAEAEARGDETPPPLHAGDFRILLAWVSQGDENVGMEPQRRVLAVTDDPEASPYVQLVCTGTGMQSSGGDGRPAPDNGLAVEPDANAGRYHIPPMMGEWELPFRWADFGVVSPEVERVTVTYAGETEDAVIEAGYYVVAGIAEEWPRVRPVITGYGADGEVLYDSREDPTYPQDPIEP
ncbi:hypothetical protein [Streptomyces sp. 6N223]|uniref:hypothetical protein n=1 Tax=Streptomyces sp. 6N223 TaxID=3457412 RepID=UPI003FD2D452